MRYFKGIVIPISIVSWLFSIGCQFDDLPGAQNDSYSSPDSDGSIYTPPVCSLDLNLAEQQYDTQMTASFSNQSINSFRTISTQTIGAAKFISGYLPYSPTIFSYTLFNIKIEPPYYENKNIENNSSKIFVQITPSCSPLCSPIAGYFNNANYGSGSLKFLPNPQNPTSITGNFSLKDKNLSDPTITSFTFTIAIKGQCQSIEY